MVILSLRIGATVSTFFALRAEKALAEKENAEQRSRIIARRFIRFLKKHPEALALPGEELQSYFLRENPDVSEQELLEAFVPPPAQPVGYVGGELADPTAQNVIGD